MKYDVFDEVVRLLKNQPSYNLQKNICDYWFDNRTELSKIVDDEHPLYSRTFDLLIRWHSELGTECNRKIIEFINGKLIKKIENGIKYLNSHNTVIDFNEFSFTYKNENYNLKKVVDSFNTSKVPGLHDLRGINLSHIDLVDCEVNNCFFAYTNFSHSNIQQVKFSNCIFTFANFDYARFVSVRYDDETSFNSISVKNSDIVGVDLRNFSNLKNIKEPSYFFLMKELIKCGLGMKNSLNKKNTVFSGVVTERNIDKGNIELVSYIDWFQYVIKNIRNIRDLSLFEKIKFSLALATTKYWNSGIVLFNISIIINGLYTLIYYVLRDQFDAKLEGIIDCIYFSISTFTSGFGDRSPISNISKLAVTTEVFIGYTILGAFIFLLSKKISKLF